MPSPVPNPSREIEKLWTRTCDMAASRATVWLGLLDRRRVGGCDEGADLAPEVVGGVLVAAVGGERFGSEGHGDGDRDLLARQVAERAGFAREQRILHHPVAGRDDAEAVAVAILLREAG